MRTLIAPPTNIHPKKKLKEKRKLTKKKRSARREGDLDKVVVSNKPPIFLWGGGGLLLQVFFRGAQAISSRRGKPGYLFRRLLSWRAVSSYAPSSAVHYPTLPSAKPVI
jgi:hypothetical protein